MTPISWLAPVVVFSAVFSGALAVAGAFRGKSDKRLQTRLDSIQKVPDTEAAHSLLREVYLRDLNGLERWLESLPGMQIIERLGEQSGRPAPAYRLVLLSLLLAALVAGVLLMLGREWVAVVVFFGILPLPYMRLVRERNKRIRLFEDQLPDTLDTISRALRAGNPFAETLKVVAQEMPEPIAQEFGIVFSDINFGVSVKSAFLGLLERVPNVSIAAVVAAVLVQRETGGNLAEILERVAQMLRQRHRFQRRIRTLTAEGKMSAYVLVSMPFALALALSIIAPDYLPIMTTDPLGIKLVFGAAAFMIIGIIWIRRMIRVRF